MHKGLIYLIIYCEAGPILSFQQRFSQETLRKYCHKEELQQMKNELKDRFGPIPQQVEDLFITVRCRKLAVDSGFEKMSLKDDVLRAYFINRPDSPYFESAIFQKVLSFIQTETTKAKLKQTGRLFVLVAEPMNSMDEMYQFLFRMHQFCFVDTMVQANSSL